MNKILFNIFLVSIFIFTIMAITIGILKVHAATPFNLTTSPVPVTLATSPGTTVTTDLRVKNPTTANEALKVTLYKFDVSPSSEVRILDRASGDSYFDWVNFSETKFTVKPNEWKTIKMTIKVPKDAAFGYYYAVGFSRQADPEAAPSAATLTGQLVTFVLLEAKVPGAKRELKVQSFNANKSTYEFLPSKLTVKVKNTGNIHVSPKGNIFIYKGSKTVATLDINAGKGNILPNSTRTFTADWSDGFPVYEPNKDGKKDQKGNLKQSLKWDLSKLTKLRFGKYTAKLVMVYDDGQRDIPIEATVSFWVIPWRVIGIVLLFVTFVMALIIYVIILRRRLKRLKNANNAKV